ncbi:MAG: type I DNA topoisomerase [Clostridia bacterium]|nr:type I DNA topoisomerase [Clostridia bacterium]
MTNLIIVESPTKAPTIKSYLGSSYKVVASKGHVRDLPKSTLGVDVENHFKPHYINIRGKGDLIRELKKEAQNADRVFLATDPDREGEAIAWHLVNTLGIPASKVRRVAFNEITKGAVKEAIKKPREIDMDLVNAQQARRLLDRIVGYKLSPFLWKNVRSGLSAGRVQSVATRIIVDRENEIRAFVPKEYWTVEADLTAPDGETFTVRYYGDEGGDRRDLNNESEAAAVVRDVTGKSFTAKEIRRYTKYKNPAPPFTTSTMQQEASRKLNFQSQRTMKVAQELYEGIHLGTENGGSQGLITYMRTDSLRISAEAQTAALAYIGEAYGSEYVPAAPRVYKTKSGAQDAHEAIRPAKVTLVPKAIRKYLSADQYKLYKLIWERFVASQMQNAELSVVSGTFTAAGRDFRASGYTVAFPGFMAVYEESRDEPDADGNAKIPALREGEKLASGDILPAQHFTEPPPRYTEASLIKFLEEKGIGRPSTYTPIITIIISRGYVARQGKSLAPTPLGEVTTGLMVQSFPNIVDEHFTAEMESSLDAVERGENTMEALLSDFYGDFAKSLDAAMDSVSKENVEIPVEETDIICEKCGAKMVVKNGRYGKFAACPNYPNCKNTKPLEAPAEPAKKIEIAPFKCELCGSDMVLRTGRYGSFYACSNYPTCKFTKPKTRPLGVKCPSCGGDLVTKYGRNHSVFYACSNYPTCQFSSWDQPTAETCPTCGGILYRKKSKNILVCKTEGCSFQKDCPPETETDAEM